MDKEQAQFILQSFRPDGADASDADFAEALELATRDRELGAWLASERSADADFAAALSQLEIPEQLRQEVLSVMHGEQDRDPSLDLAMDAAFQHGLADVEPPEGLRDQILTAMHVQQGQAKVTAMPNKKTSNVRRFFQLTAVAAALVLGAFLAVQMTQDKEDARLASHDVQQAAGALLNANFKFDQKSQNLDNINTWLVSNDLPAPERLPAQLRKMKSLGCKKIMLAGDKVASLVCFAESNGGSVHLVIIRNEDVEDTALPTMDKVMENDCYHCPKTDWNVVRWKDDEQTYILMARHDKEQTGNKSMLRYF